MTTLTTNALNKLNQAFDSVSGYSSLISTMQSSSTLVSNINSFVANERQTKVAIRYTRRIDFRAFEKNVALINTLRSDFI